MNTIKGTITIWASALLTGVMWGSEAVKGAQDALSEWIEVEKQIAADESEWAVEKEVLKNSIDFMKTEVTRLEDVIKTAEETASAGERKRAELDEKKTSYDSVMEEVKNAIAGYEKSIKKLATKWPKGFLTMVERPLSNIPTGDEEMDVALTVRLQNIVVLLSQFDKFQSMISKDIEIQDIDGNSREVTTLYYGFAYAYFVDGTGEYAGYGYPSLDDSEGWYWEADASLAPKVQNLVAVFDRSQEAVFVDLPAKITTP